MQLCLHENNTVVLSKLERMGSENLVLVGGRMHLCICQSPMHLLQANNLYVQTVGDLGCDGLPYGACCTAQPVISSPKLIKESSTFRSLVHQYTGPEGQTL
jgi:hypothetical protein